MIGFVLYTIFCISKVSGFHLLKTQKWKTGLKNKHLAVDFSVSYGDFNGSIFNKRRNIYFWPNNMNILPISKEKARTISTAWKLSQVEEDILYQEDYHNFKSDLNTKKRLYYKWAPYKDKNNIRGLISTELYHQHKNIRIKQILMKPYLSPNNFDLLISDLEQMKLFNEYRTYNIDLSSVSFDF